MEEKKNLTEDERKKLKDNLKKQIDEMSDEELDMVAGGYEVWRPSLCSLKRYKFTEEEVKLLLKLGFKIEANQEYKYDELLDIFQLHNRWPGNNLLEHEKELERWMEHNFGFNKS